MKVAIMQPYVFPYIGYFQLIQAVDTFVFYNDVNFIKKGYINRNSILVNDESYQFTIPCKRVSQNKLIKDVELYLDEKTRLKFLKTLSQAYQEAPYFSVVFPLLDHFFKNNESLTISEFAIESILLIAKYLDLQKKWIISSESHEASKHLIKEYRILDIAKKEGASAYINPIGGYHLYSKKHFKSEEMALYFIKSLPIIYKQFSSEFVPSLSIIDILMFNNKDKVKELLNQYELI